MTLVSFFGNILAIINGVIVPLIFAIAFIVFLWGIYTYFIAGGADEDKRKEGRNLALYGLIGFFVMFSVWGLVNILLNTAALNTTRPALPSSVETCILPGLCF